MNYQETIDFLFSRLPLFSRIGEAAYRKDLTNTLSLCAFLGNPERTFKTIHIAGTNGKGSVSHMLAAILQAAGYKTGLYTSPHLHDFRERIRINGEMIPSENVVSFTQQIQPILATLDASFFEVTVAMAFDYFSKEKVDIAVIETGMGGRLDSTNIILPELSVITNIGWDHMQFLGDSLEKIALEKAGIIKEGKPVVIGQEQPTIRAVFEKQATTKNASISFATDHWILQHTKWNKDFLQIAVKNKDRITHYELELLGIYQQDNLLTVLESISQLKNLSWKIDDIHVVNGLKSTKKMTGFRGRWDILSQSPLTILDVAHNEDGIHQVLKQLPTISYENLHIVTGMVKDKAIDKLLRLFPRNARYYFTNAQLPRALPAAELAAAAHQLGLEGSIYQEVNEAISAAREAAHPKDLVLICGSIFIAAEVELDQFPKS
jgi:dihydrofolate synthase/folylpolyglutamate synthase